MAHIDTEQSHLERPTLRMVKRVTIDMLALTALAAGGTAAIDAGKDIHHKLSHINIDTDNILDGSVKH